MKKSRACGSCSACCTYLRIDSEPGFSTRLDNAEDVAKAAGEPCRFLTENRCGIYAVRPIVCRRFKCDWLLGRVGFAFEDSPPKTGFFAYQGNQFKVLT